jgi:hypothetical protein
MDTQVRPQVLLSLKVRHARTVLISPEARVRLLLDNADGLYVVVHGVLVHHAFRRAPEGAHLRSRVHPLARVNRGLNRQDWRGSHGGQHARRCHAAAVGRMNDRSSGERRRCAERHDGLDK